jgi:hypothetical protein
MSDVYQINLARTIEAKMAKILAHAGHSVVPPGTLEVGLSVSQINGTEHAYDRVRGVLTVTGVVKIDVRGLPKVA